VTTRGFAEAEMAEVGRLIAQVLGNLQDASVIDDVRHRVMALTERFPLYAWRQQMAAA
jgi:glycine hydroxymethyltransferase